MKFSLSALIVSAVFYISACGGATSTVSGSGNPGPAVNTVKVLDWGDRFRSMHGTTILGRTSDNRGCSFAVWDKTVHGSSLCGGGLRRQAYISLGTDRGRDDFTTSYVGFWINPDCTYGSPYTVKAMEVTNQTVHIQVVTDEGTIRNVENDLYILMDPVGRVTEVRGWSSHYPGSTCFF